MLIHDRTSLFEIVAVLATAVAASISAFASTVPGTSRKWLLVPLVPLAVWLANIGKTCVADWMRFGVRALVLWVDGPCFLPMVLMTIVPVALMLLMLRRVAPLHPRLPLALGTLAIAAPSNLALRSFHGPYLFI